MAGVIDAETGEQLQEAHGRLLRAVQDLAVDDEASTQATLRLLRFAAEAEDEFPGYAEVLQRAGELLMIMTKVRQGAGL